MGQGGDFSLDGKVALVTGGGRGLGRVVAVGLSRHGASVTVAGRTPASLDEAVEEIRAGGGEAHAVRTDISRLEEIDSLVADVVARHGRLDVLVNNAAIGAPLKAAEEVTPVDWDALMATNLRGTFFLTTRAAKEMMRSGGGSIVNISSITEEVAGPRAAVYAAAKGGIRQLTRTLAVEWARHGIRVNSVGPGYIATDLTEGLQQDGKTSDYVLTRTPMRRFAHPEEFVGAVVYLASDASSFQTGQTILVDGGWTAW